MMVQKPDVVGLLCGSLRGTSLGCVDDLKEAGQSFPVVVAVERAEAPALAPASIALSDPILCW